MLLIQFFLAHLIADFWLQPAKWVSDKESLKARSPWIYLHVGIHFLFLMIVTRNLELWLPALVITIAHLLIDLSKIYFQRESTRKLWFFMDQLAHVVSMVLVWYLFDLPEPKNLGLDTGTWVLITGAVALTTPAVFSIATLLDPLGKYLKNTDKQGLPSGGAYIGVLERLLAFGFITSGYWAGVGFLLAAKSIFRFGDLTRAKDRKLTEYILIGTLMSFALAIVAGLCYVHADPIISWIKAGIS